MALSDSLKKYMNKMNIGNKELSKLSGVPLRTVNNILGGITDNPTLETVKALAHALGCTLDDIADDMGVNNGMVADTGSYYLDPEAAEIAQEMFEREEMRVLFDASRNVSKDDILEVANLLKKLQNK